MHLRKLCVRESCMCTLCVVWLSALPVLCRQDKKVYVECLRVRLLFSAFESRVNVGILRAVSLRKPYRGVR